MNDLDKMIEETLDAEDRLLHAELGEQGLFGQVFSVFHGKQGWIGKVIFVVSFIIFGFAVFSGWKFLNAEDSVAAMQWGAAGVLFMLMVSFIKIWFWMRMESNRILREVKRVELQIARLQLSQQA